MTAPAHENGTATNTASGSMNDSNMIPISRNTNVAARSSGEHHLLLRRVDLRAPVVLVAEPLGEQVAVEALLDLLARAPRVSVVGGVDDEARARAPAFAPDLAEVPR